MARSITFTIKGPVDTLIKIEELDDGTLRFDMQVLGSGLLGDLRGMFFDLGDLDATTAGLLVTGIEGSEDVIGKTVFDEQAVTSVTNDVNVNGSVIRQQGRFDGGIEFGTPGKGKDDISSASFILSANEPLSLDSFDLADFGLRYTSVGTGNKRNDSEKIAGEASGIARNDAWEVDENSEGTVDLLLNDTNGVQPDGSRKTVISVVDAQGALDPVDGGFQRTVVDSGGLVLGTLFVSSDGFAKYVADGPDVDKLAHDDLRLWSFTYETRSSEGNLATAEATLTIDGQNDRPEAFDVSVSVHEDDAFDTVQSPQFQPLVGDGVTGSFVGSDIDIGDVLSYAIISSPVDAYGNQYGEVVNNNDGTFTFNPKDEFQFLNAGETRDVTFQYVVIDDSGVGTSSTAPEESDTSAAATITVTVIGADDAPVEFSDQLLFQTNNQSMFGTGTALIFQPDLPFLGFDTGSKSLNATLYGSRTFSGSTLEGILDGIEAVGQAFADLGCEIGSWFGADCDVDVDLPSSISTPSVRTEGSFAAKVGLQPYFSFNSGEVNASVPVDVVFSAPRQVENGDTFSVSSAYTVDGGATFSTMSPNVNFGMDFVFDIDTALDLLIGSNRFDIWDIDTATLSNFTGKLGQPGFNIFDASGEDLELSVPLGPLDPFFALDLNFPVINTTGTQDVPGGNTLSSSGSDEVAVLTADLDAFASQLAFGYPSAFGDSDSFGLSTSVAGVSLNLLSVEWTWDLVSVALITTLETLQDFSLSVEDLPLLATLEDGSVITGFSLGDEITVNTPATTNFDPDIDGNADGLIDLYISVDMEALFSNDTYLGLDLDLFVGLLSFTAGLTSDFFTGPSVSLFDGIIPSIDGNDDGFLLGHTFSLVEDVRLATLFNEEIEIVGWNKANTDTLFFDVA